MSAKSATDGWKPVGSPEEELNRIQQELDSSGKKGLSTNFALFHLRSNDIAHGGSVGLAYAASETSPVYIITCAHNLVHDPDGDVVRQLGQVQESRSRFLLCAPYSEVEVECEYVTHAYDDAHDCALLQSVDPAVSWRSLRNSVTPALTTVRVLCSLSEWRDDVNRETLMFISKRGRRSGLTANLSPNDEDVYIVQGDTDGEGDSGGLLYAGRRVIAMHMRRDNTTDDLVMMHAGLAEQTLFSLFDVPGIEFMGVLAEKRL
eukprot:Opistho-1_new@11537